MNTERALPLPDSEELRNALGRSEERMAVYAFLFERRNDPPTMTEIRRHVENRMGKAHVQTDRRVRDLRDSFLVRAELVPGTRNDYRYVLEGWLPEAIRRQRRERVSPKTEAKVFSRWGARCAYCGESPREHGVRLVIDHIVPLHLGGTNDIENLQPLCEFHNQGKQAHFKEHAAHNDAIRAAIGLPEAHLRIGELLKAMAGEEVPVDLINLVACEENRGDPTKRLRELRLLGWLIDVTKRKEGRRTRSFYTLRHWEPWPPEGPRAAVNGIEAERKRRKRMQSSGPTDEAA